MPRIQIETEIDSDAQTCFDLARDIDFHNESFKNIMNIPIAGKINGLIELGEWVSWETQHLGIALHITSKVTKFNRPYFYVDKLVCAAFKKFTHEHIFQERENKVVMIDRLCFKSTYHLLGNLTDHIFLKSYLKRLLLIRNKALKSRAEGLYREKCNPCLNRRNCSELNGF